MKRYGYLFEKITDMENIRLAHKNAKKGKTHYDEVKKVDSDPEKYLEEIQRLLVSGEFTTSGYKVSKKRDKGKVRTLHKLPYFPDRIVHHAIMQILEPIWKKSMIANSFQSIKGRGPHKAIKKIKKDVKYKENMYYVKMDIKKYYPSINNERLKGVIRKKVKCEKTLTLLDDIIDSCKGVPIGNYISQYFGNLYLNQLDHTISSIKNLRYYRYCDDIVYISNSKGTLWYAAKIVLKHARQSKLVVKPLCMQKITKSQGLDYLGYVVHCNRVKLRKSIKNKACRTINYRNECSYNGWLQYCNGHNLRTKLKENLNGKRY